MSESAFRVPEWLGWLPTWVFGLVLIAGALVAALTLYGLVVRAVARGVRQRSEFVRSLVVRTRAPGRFALMVAALSWAVGVAPLPDGPSGVVQHLLLIAFIVLVGWAVLTAVDIGSAIYLRRYRTDIADNLQARKHLTQTRILRQALSVLVMIVTAGLALTTIPGVRQLGVSLLAAGGAAGLIVGLAFQPVLSNVIAGVQLAFTQPIRIDDAVVVQNEFGRIEEINSTYVVVRLWDLRRLIVPLKYFLEQPFQNWTRQSSDLIGAVTLLIDQRAPVGALRAKVEEIVRGSALWDGKLVKVQVTDIRERALEIRCLVSARHADAAFDLRAEVREKVMEWLQAEFPASLPRNGVEFAPPAGPSDDGPAPDAPQPHGRAAPVPTAGSV